MAGYQPLKITGNSTGLVENRENFLLPDDAYPVLLNAYVWRERILRKSGFTLLGRLQRDLVSISAGSVNFAPTITYNLFTALGLSTSQPNASIVPGTALNPMVIIIGAETLTDNTGTGVFTIVPGGFFSSATINYATGVLTIITSTVFVSAAVTVTLSYYPNLPVMGIRIQELQNSANDQTIFFDQVYAYIFNGTTNLFQEFIPGTTWNIASLDVTGTDFFWSTNYWTSGSAGSPFGTSNVKLFWVTNNSGHSGALADPPRITDGTTWVNFFPSAWSQIDATNFLTNWLAMLPFRGRMVTFNTWEGINATSSINYRQRIRWSTIGNPFIAYTAGPPAAGSWRSDIRGQGGFLDIPTSEDIVSVGFVRDNLVIYCERSTWQLRYTGRSIAPFQIEKVNSELGAESTFSAVQFDTSLVGIGDKGIVECDSYKSERIDIKIPDFVFQFNSLNNGVSRVQGIRDFPNRLAYWTVPLVGAYDGAIPSASRIFPNIRLVYNYENDSWATFSDSLTALGNFQKLSSQTWLTTPQPWVDCNFSWIDQAPADPQILGGNQQGFVEILNNQTVNDVSLFISNITQGSSVIITSPNHNMYTNINQNESFIIGISGIPTGTPFSSLNGGVFGVTVIDANSFYIYTYDAISDEYDQEVTGTPAGVYVGGGLINLRENFSIKSKKFNFLDEGQNIQMGYLDILMVSQGPNGAIALNVYLNYDDSTVSNTYPQNVIDNGVLPDTPDTFFNAVILTNQSTLSGIGGTKFWQRVFCPTRSNFLTLEYTFNNAQLASQTQQLSVQIDAQILWIRKAGRMTTV